MQKIIASILRKYTEISHIIKNNLQEFRRSYFKNTREDLKNTKDLNDNSSEDDELPEYISYRVRTPTLLQMEATECGAAALGIVLGYYGKYLPLEVLRVDCGISRDGSKALNMVKAARRYGFVCQGVKVDEPEVLAELKFPVIAFWEFNHFVVVEGIKGDKYYLNDPATGPRVIKRDEFSRLFTGIVLTLEPGPDFKKEGAPLSIIKLMKNRLKDAINPLTYIIFASLALVIPGIMVPGFSKVFIDDILIRHMNSWLNLLIVGMVLTAILRGILTWLQQKCLLQLHLKIMLINSAKMLWHVLYLPIIFFQQRFAGDLEARVGANDRVAQLLSGGLSSSAVGIITMSFYAVIMLLLSWKLSLLAITVAFFNAGLFYFIARRIADTSRQFLQQQGRLNGLAMNGLQLIETIKATAIEDGFFSRWASEHAKTINSQQNIMMYGVTLQIIPGILSGLAGAAVLGWGAWQIMQGQITVGTLVAFQSLAASFSGPLGTLLGLAQQTQQIRGDFMRLDDVLKHPIDPAITNAEEPAPTDVNLPLPGNLKITDVTFGYSKLEEPFIQNFSLDLKVGKKIAVVGKTGSGKSTLAKLICRLYQPWAGDIELGDKPLAKIPPIILSKTVAFVDQDIFLFSGTIRDNLTLWNPEIPDYQIYDALKDACVDDLVQERGGIDTEVTEGGINFSGGQRQRLEIARALATNPSLLILDEATSSLDPVMELKVYENIKRRNCTLLIIAHRLSAIRDCDEIIVLQQGKIVEQGTHQELVANDGFYQQLIKTGE